MKYDPWFHIVLFQPEIPQNTGNIGRTCVAARCKMWLVKPLGFSLDDYYMRRAGLDYWDDLEWEVVDDWQQLLTRLPPRRPYIFTKNATQTYCDVQYEKGDIFVFGRESSGLPAELHQAYADRSLRVPMYPEVRSLNLANTVAIIVYEAHRQLGLQNLG